MIRIPPQSEASAVPAAAAAGEGALRPLARLHDLYLRLVRIGDRGLPEAVNPFTQLGAYANLNFIIAIVSGVLLLFWYRPSVHAAYASMKAMEASPFLGGLIQSLHRYSSDACVLFTLVHGLEALMARRFQRPRWLAWVTGLCLMAMLWAEGWLGYWLVWDDRALAIAAGTARALDVLPIFEEPLSRSFLTTAGLSSLFFFVIFFIHMLVPLVFALGLWLHIARLNRPRFLTGKAATLVMLGFLAFLSLAWPAQSGAAADPSALGAGDRLDLYYMLPLLLEGRAGAAAYIALFAAAACVLLLLPLFRGRVAAVKPVVQAPECTGCKRCYEDCPFNAISMVADEEGKLKAEIDPDVCMACGNCVGACNPHAVDYPDFPLENAEAKVRDWFGGRAGEPRLLAFLCRNSAAAGLRPDPETGMCPDLPGYRCFQVPCTGWILPRLLEFAARAGAAGTLVAGCGPGTPSHRLGTEWTLLRLMGKRLPTLSLKRVEGMALETASFNRPEGKDLLEAARAFRVQVEGEGVTKIRLHSHTLAARPRSRAATAAVSASALVALFLLLGFASRAPHRPAFREASRLVVSFKHAAGHVKEVRKEKAEEEKLPIHMRGQQMARERRKLRLRVSVDGKVVADHLMAPRGFFKDGASSGIETLELEPGRHRVAIVFREEDPAGSEADPDASGSAAGGPGASETDAGGHSEYAEEREVDFAPGKRAVVVFQGKDGFQWH